MALEGALKLTEISYVPTDSYAAGEMKHGPIALLSEETPVICVATVRMSRWFLGHVRGLLTEVRQAADPSACLEQHDPRDHALVFGRVDGGEA